MWKSTKSNEEMFTSSDAEFRPLLWNSEFDTAEFCVTSSRIPLAEFHVTSAEFQIGFCGILRYYLQNYEFDSLEFYVTTSVIPQRFCRILCHLCIILCHMWKYKNKMCYLITKFSKNSEDKIIMQRTPKVLGTMSIKN